MLPKTSQTDTVLIYCINSKNKTKASQSSALLGISQSKSLPNDAHTSANQPCRKLMQLGTAELEVEG